MCFLEGGSNIGGHEHPRGRDEWRTVENGLACTTARRGGRGGGGVRLPASSKSFLSYRKPSFI